MTSKDPLKLGFVHFCTPPAVREALMRNFIPKTLQEFGIIRRKACSSRSCELKLRLKASLTGIGAQNEQSRA